MGVKFALDDFGAGFSSLSYLKDLTVDCLKIDRSFIQEILVNKKNIELVEVIINLGKIFKLEIVAEGVETVENCIVLMRYGCDTVQGYMISKPMLGSSVINWVESYTPESQWYDWKDIFWDKKDFPLLMAEVDHIVWIEKVIKETLNETSRIGVNPDYNLLLSYQTCRFGKWYYSIGMERFSENPVFIEIEPIHQQVHELGEKIFDLKSSGNTKKLQALTEDLLALRDRIIALMMKLKVSFIEELENRGKQ